MRTVLLPPIAWVYPAGMPFTVTPNRGRCRSASADAERQRRGHLWVTSGHFGKCNWGVRFGPIADIRSISDEYSNAPQVDQKALFYIGGATPSLPTVIRSAEFVEILSHANKISSNSAREIAQLMRHPQYNCDLVACDAALARRNHIVRSELDALLASATRPDDAQISHGAKAISRPLSAVH